MRLRLCPALWPSRRRLQTKAMCTWCLAELTPPRAARPKTTTAVARRLISNALGNSQVGRVVCGYRSCSCVVTAAASVIAIRANALGCTRIAACSMVVTSPCYRGSPFFVVPCQESLPPMAQAGGGIKYGRPWIVGRCQFHDLSLFEHLLEARGGVSHVALGFGVFACCFSPAACARAGA